MLIVLVVILLALFAWPGYIWANAHKLEGYWASNESGNIYRIAALTSRKLAISIKGHISNGTIYGIRKIRHSGMCGSVEFNNRKIKWSTGEKWVKQGI